MGRFFTRERFGRPQVLASCLLLAFLAQCLWLVEKGVRHESVNPAEIYRLERGNALWKGLGAGSSGDARGGARPGRRLRRRNGSGPPPGLRRRRLRCPPFAVVVSDCGGPVAAAAGGAPAGKHSRPALVGGRPLPVFWTAPRRFAVVRGTAPLRQCRRIHSLGALLFLARNCPILRAVVCRA